MAYIPFSSITGCTSPTTGSSFYEPMYNDAKIISYYKKDDTINFVRTFMVVVVFDNGASTIFQFTSQTNRDNFYDILPT